MAAKTKRREVVGPISRVRARERRQASSVIKNLGLRLQAARVSVELNVKLRTESQEAARAALAAKDEELAKVKREYDVEVRAGMEAQQEVHRLKIVVVEQAKAIWHWPALLPGGAGKGGG